MSQSTAKFITLADTQGTVFTGGLITNSEPNVLPYHNTPLAYNFRVNAGGISIRPGYYTFSSLTGTGWKPFWLSPYIWNGSFTYSSTIPPSYYIEMPIWYDTTKNSVGQKIVVTQGGTLTSISIRMNKAWTPAGNLSVKLFTNQWTNLFATSSTVAESTLVATTAGTNISFTFSNVNMDIWTYYFVVSTDRANSTSNYVNVLNGVYSGTVSDNTAYQITSSNVWNPWNIDNSPTLFSMTLSFTKKTMVVWYKSDSTHYLSLVDPVTWEQTNISTGTNITNETRMNFINANGSIYCMNGLNPYWKLTNTTYTTPSTGISNFTPAFWVFWNNCGWVSWNPNDPTKLYKSSANSLDTYATTPWTDVFTSPFPIKGLGVNQQSLYVFSEYGIDVFNTNSINQVWSTLVYQSKSLEATEWCTNHNLIVSIGKGIFYISPSNKIRQITPTSFGMYDFTELSHRAGNGISPTMEWLDSDQSQGFGYAIPEKQLICWHLKSKEAVYNDTVIVYNYEFDEWLLDTNKSFSNACLINSIPYAISAITPIIYRDEYGDTDDDSPIQFRYDTKKIDLWNPTILKNLWQTRTFLKLNSKTKLYQRIYADGALIDEKLIDFSTIPIVTWGIGTQPYATFPTGTGGDNETLANTIIVRDKGYLNVRAKSFWVSYVSYDTGWQVLIQNITPQMEMLPFETTSYH